MQNPAEERRVIVGFALVALICAVFVVVLNPDLVCFRPFSVADFVQLIAPLLMVALFIERVQEVFPRSWRAESATKLERKSQAARKRRGATDPHSRFPLPVSPANPALPPTRRSADPPYHLASLTLNTTSARIPAE